MGLLLDLVYAMAVLLALPIWLPRMARSGKIRAGWRARLGAVPPSATRQGPSPRILVHAVSVGELNAIRLLVDHLRGDTSNPEIVIATTTQTGFERATSLWGARHSIVRYPLDLSACVRRFLNGVQPDLVVLIELEVWPNFTAACRRRGIPVCVVNGRLTQRSFRRYRLVRWLVRPSFRRLAFVAAQDEVYAQRFRDLGARSGAVVVTDTMKWDTAQLSVEVPGAEELARDMGIDRTRPLVVAGSTAPGEHELLAASTPAGVQLLCAPRRPEWFDQAAQAMPGCCRRSRGERGSSTGRFLLDSIGELRQAYALADVVVIGRSFGDLHGSDMMEPIALGKPVIVGPAVTDFQQTVDALLEAGGIIQTTVDRLALDLKGLLDDAQRCAELAERGRGVIRQRQGATARNAELILELLQQAAPKARPQQKPAVPALSRDGGGGERRKAREDVGRAAQRSS